MQFAVQEVQRRKCAALGRRIDDLTPDEADAMAQLASRPFPATFRPLPNSHPTDGMAAPRTTGIMGALGGAVAGGVAGSRLGATFGVPGWVLGAAGGALAGGALGWDAQNRHNLQAEEAVRRGAQTYFDVPDASGTSPHTALLAAARR